MNHKHTSDICEIKRIVLDAGKILLGGTGKQLIIKEKTSYKDLVTQYDTLIQE